MCQLVVGTGVTGVAPESHSPTPTWLLSEVDADEKDHINQQKMSLPRMERWHRPTTAKPRAGGWVGSPWGSALSKTPGDHAETPLARRFSLDLGATQMWG